MMTRLKEALRKLHEDEDGMNTVETILLLVIALVVVAGLQYATSFLYPLPEGLDPFDPADADALGEHMASMPISAWLLAFASEVVGVFLGALTAGSIARDRKIATPRSTLGCTRHLRRFK